jgi:saccharopine dehydrogenase-like NADP-dependent oxidoreductase
MSYDFLIFGGSGMQGTIVAKYLLQKGYTVTLADIKEEGAKPLLEQLSKALFRHIDLRKQEAIVSLISELKPAVVINCAEMDWNMNVYRACLVTKTHVIDLGSTVPMTQEQLDMHADFEGIGVTAITGAGSTPGINNILMAYGAEQFETVESVELGFAWDSNVEKFVVPFSIETLIEEFVVPAEVVEKGELLMKDPLDQVVEKEFTGIGKQSCILVHHSETLTFHRYLKPKGIQDIRFYGGFPKQIFEPTRMFVELGLGSTEPIMIGDKPVVPLEALDAVLRKLPRPENYKEHEILWVELRGIKNGKPKRMFLECRVDTLPGWEDAGSNIDTGIPAGIMAEMIHKGVIDQRGSFAPEDVVPAKTFLQELQEYGMKIFVDGEAVVW